MKKITAAQLDSKTIDIHSHVGVSWKSYSKMEYPYAETVESLCFKQMASHVDVNVVFPLGPESFCDMPHFLLTGEIRKGATGDDFPYQSENAFLLREIYDLCPEFSGRVMPFLTLDPGRCFGEQLKSISSLWDKYPFYGFKISPVLCQSKVKKMIEWEDLFAFAEENHLALLFHTSCDEKEEYSYVADIFKVIDKYDKVNYCLAHCIGFHKEFLDEADRRTNVWVDSSALKIQVRLAADENSFVAGKGTRVDADYSDHRIVFRTLVDAYPDTMIWGTDSPAYSYMVKRRTVDGSLADFKLKGSYLDEKAALDFLNPKQIEIVSNLNSVKFLFHSSS